MNAAEVKRLIAKGEGQFLEFKPGPTRPTELASSLAAFANADGGTLLLGVVERPDGEPWIEGVGNRKVTIDHLHTAAGLCSPKVELTPLEEINVDGRLVLAVTVPGGLRQVYSVQRRRALRRARGLLSPHAGRWTRQRFARYWGGAASSCSTHNPSAAPRARIWIVPWSARTWSGIGQAGVWARTLC